MISFIQIPNTVIATHVGQKVERKLGLLKLAFGEKRHAEDVFVKVERGDGVADALWPSQRRSPRHGGGRRGSNTR